MPEPKCNKCWDKGFSTQMRGEQGRHFYKAPTIQKNYCTCKKGKAVQRYDLTKEQ